MNNYEYFNLLNKIKKAGSAVKNVTVKVGATVGDLETDRSY